MSNNGADGINGVAASLAAQGMAVLNALRTGVHTTEARPELVASISIRLLGRRPRRAAQAGDGDAVAPVVVYTAT